MDSSRLFLERSLLRHIAQTPFCLRKIATYSCGDIPNLIRKCEARRVCLRASGSLWTIDNYFCVGVTLDRAVMVCIVSITAPTNTMIAANCSCERLIPKAIANMMPVLITSEIAFIIATGSVESFIYAFRRSNAGGNDSP